MARCSLIMNTKDADARKSLPPEYVAPDYIGFK